jgi:predicted flap endonuclease-1-like 5' DNA nuclease
MNKERKGNPFKVGARAVLKEGQKVGDQAVVLLLENRNVKNPVLYYTTQGKLRLVGVGEKSEITVQTFNPLNTFEKKEDHEIINLVEIQNDFIIFKEYGVIRIGRGRNRKMALVPGKTWKAPYALTKEEKLEIDGVAFEPLLKEIKRKVIELEKKGKINPTFGIGEDKCSQQGRMFVDEDRMPKEDEAIKIVKANLLCGYAIGITNKKRLVLLKLSDFMDQGAALDYIKPGRTVFSDKVVKISEDSRAKLKALKIRVPESKNSEKKELGAKKERRFEKNGRPRPKAQAPRRKKAVAQEVEVVHMDENPDGQTTLGAALSEAKVVGKDDLTKINGIGLKMAKMLEEKGIVNFKQLAHAKPNGVAKEAWVKEAKKLVKA